MNRWWRKRPARRIEAPVLSVLDLGSTAVKALVIRRTDDRVTILGRGRSPVQTVMPTQHVEPTGDAALDVNEVLGDLDALTSMCEEALCEAEDATEATSASKVVPDMAWVALPPSWLRGAIGVGNVQRAALEVPVSAEECQESVIRAGRQAVSSLESIAGSESWEPVDATVAAYDIDGQRVTDPLGFRGYLLEATVFVTAAPSLVLSALRQLAERLQLETPRFVAEPFALAAASPGDGLVLDVGAQTTGMVLVRGGAPLAFGSIDQGGSSLTRALADAFAFSPFRAESLKWAYGAGQLSDEGALAVRRVLASPLGAWLSSLAEHLRSWDGAAETWSPDIYLCGGTCALADVQESVSQMRWLDVLPFPRTPRVRLWDGSNLTQVVDRSEPRWQLGDVVTLSLAVWSARQRSRTGLDKRLRESLGIE